MTRNRNLWNPRRLLKRRKSTILYSIEYNRRAIRRARTILNAVIVFIFLDDHAALAFQTFDRDNEIHSKKTKIIKAVTCLLSIHFVFLNQILLILVNLSAVVMANALEARLGARIKCQ